MHVILLQDGETAFMKACQFGHDTIAMVLLEYSARIDVQDEVKCFYCY